MTTTYALRQAVPSDALAIAKLFGYVRVATMPYLPVLHTPEEDHRYFASTISSSEVWAAESDGALVGFCAYREGWVDHLYVSPLFARIKIGTGLLKNAQDANDELRLWAFQRNSAALAFYEAMVFKELERTSGVENEEREPDVLIQWKRKVA